MSAVHSRDSPDQIKILKHLWTILLRVSSCPCRGGYCRIATDHFVRIIHILSFASISLLVWTIWIVSESLLRSVEANVDGLRGNLAMRRLSLVENLFECGLAGCSFAVVLFGVEGKQYGAMKLRNGRIAGKQTTMTPTSSSIVLQKSVGLLSAEAVSGCLINNIQIGLHVKTSVRAYLMIDCSLRALTMVIL